MLVRGLGMQALLKTCWLPPRFLRLPPPALARAAATEAEADGTEAFPRLTARPKGPTTRDR